jgi:hypothetical protein
VVDLVSNASAVRSFDLALVAVSLKNLFANLLPRTGILRLSH